MIEKNLGGRGVKSTERDDALLAACAKGDKTRQETADEFCISRCRLMQILRDSDPVKKQRRLDRIKAKAAAKAEALALAKMAAGVPV